MADRIFDELTAGGIREYLDPACSALRIEVLPEVSSTNTLLKEKALAGAPAGTVLIADRQTTGRGRSGKSFHSPAGTGLYMSILTNAEAQDSARTLSVTTMSAVAAAEAAEAVSGREARIKWVNDIYMEERKVCGILAEALTSPTTGRPDRIVLGAGFNVYEPEDGFPAEIAEIAGAIRTRVEPGVRSRLAAEFLNRFYGILKGGRSDYEADYRRRSLLTGRRILVLSETDPREAAVLGLDEQLRLLVRYDDGTEAALNAGEVSLKLS